MSCSLVPLFCVLNCLNMVQIPDNIYTCSSVNTMIISCNQDGIKMNLTSLKPIVHWETEIKFAKQKKFRNGTEPDCCFYGDFNIERKFSCEERKKLAVNSAEIRLLKLFYVILIVLVFVLQ